MILNFPVTEDLFTVRQVTVTEDMFPMYHENVPLFIMFLNVLVVIVKYVI